MKPINNLLIVAAIGFTGFLSCSNSHKDAVMNEAYSMSQIATEDEKSPADKAMEEVYEVVKHQAPPDAVRFVPPTIVPNFVASSAASTAFDDGVHKFIRTAQVKFKVKDVVSATRKIEDVALINKGFIIKSSVNNENFRTETINISKDSAMVKYYCNLVSSINLKVPASSLDTVLRQIAPLALIVDYRIIDADDVTVKLMSDKLAQIRLAKRQKRISNAISTTGRKLDDIMAAEDALDETLADADRKVISEYNINEQIAYSTISISLYQDRIEYSEKVLRQAPYEEYTPGFGSKIADGFAAGWSAVSMVFLCLVYIWPLWVLVGIGVFLFIWFRKRSGRAKE
ncbi:DUF4349 domain-containing protein [Prevotella sp. 10(H)]|uniref:DUF4349 domain-containing protein n=1 Tax=Prevotella sp. 10(H) TaxID=1158294 RepID=UPI0009DD7B58|nr:DUF4349 domain-containing protein [Prevotella sp. 10(H)]